MIKQKLLTLSLLMFSIVFFSSLAIGQNSSQQIDIADISNNGNNVSWLIKVPYERATLTVSAPNGKVFRKEFRAGEIINFAPINSRGEYYGSGRFTYEIVLTPVLSPGTRDALKEARENGESTKVADEIKKRGEIPQNLTKSGTFTFEKGAIITGDGILEEPEDIVKNDDPKVESKTRTKTSNAGDIPIENAQVILDDLVVQGSTCTGFDCANGESFGFDTLRLKENNLRIHFDDTSSTGSFPNVDWRLVANDTASGGANKFSIEDATNGKTPFTVEANAPNNSLYVDDAGRIGLGTATPAIKFHITDGNTPAVRLEQNGSSGFTPQTWDIAGNETNFFIRDVTNGSKLPFRIRPSAPDNSIYIDTDGDIGLGTASPSSKLTVESGDVEIKNGGLKFSDGTIQTTAVGGGGGSGTIDTPSIYAQQFYGGQGVRLTTSTIPFAVDTNTFGVTTNGQAGFASYLLNVNPSINLASAGATSIVYKLRYRDNDGTGTGALVRLDLVANNINDGSRSTKLLFSSNSNAATGNNTVTVCQAVDTTFFNFATHATHIAVTLVGSTSFSATFYQVQVYKIDSSCP